MSANDGLPRPGQVRDGVGDATFHAYRPGEGANSAARLAWTHAEYIKLLRSLADRAVWDHYAPVEERCGRHWRTRPSAASPKRRDTPS